MLEGIKKGMIAAYAGAVTKSGAVCRYWGCDNAVSSITPGGMAICNDHKEQNEQCIDALGYSEEEGQCYQCEQIKYNKLRPLNESGELVPLCHDCYDDLFFK